MRIDAVYLESIEQYTYIPLIVAITYTIEDGYQQEFQQFYPITVLFDEPWNEYFKMQVVKYTINKRVYYYPVPYIKEEGKFIFETNDIPVVLQPTGSIDPSYMAQLDTVENQIKTSANMRELKNNAIQYEDVQNRFVTKVEPDKLESFENYIKSKKIRRLEARLRFLTDKNSSEYIQINRELHELDPEKYPFEESNNENEPELGIEKDIEDTTNKHPQLLKQTELVNIDNSKANTDDFSTAESEGEGEINVIKVVDISNTDDILINEEVEENNNTFETGTEHDNTFETSTGQELSTNNGISFFSESDQDEINIFGQHSNIFGDSIEQDNINSSNNLFSSTRDNEIQISADQQIGLDQSINLFGDDNVFNIDTDITTSTTDNNDSNLLGEDIDSSAETIKIENNQQDDNTNVFNILDITESDEASYEHSDEMTFVYNAENNIMLADDDDAESEVEVDDRQNADIFSILDDVGEEKPASSNTSVSIDKEDMTSLIDTIEIEKKSIEMKGNSIQNEIKNLSNKAGKMVDIMQDAIEISQKTESVVSRNKALRNNDISAKIDTGISDEAKKLLASISEKVLKHETLINAIPTAGINKSLKIGRDNSVNMKKFIEDKEKNKESFLLEDNNEKKLEELREIDVASNGFSSDELRGKLQMAKNNKIEIDEQLVKANVIVDEIKNIKTSDYLNDKENTVLKASELIEKLSAIKDNIIKMNNSVQNGTESDKNSVVDNVDMFENLQEFEDVNENDLEGDDLTPDDIDIFGNVKLKDEIPDFATKVNPASDTTFVFENINEKKSEDVFLGGSIKLGDDDSDFESFDLKDDKSFFVDGDIFNNN